MEREYDDESELEEEDPRMDHGKFNEHFYENLDQRSAGAIDDK